MNATTTVALESIAKCDRDAVLSKIQIKYGEWVLDHFDLWKLPLTYEQILTARQTNPATLVVRYRHQSNPQRTLSVWLTSDPYNPGSDRYSFEIEESYENAADTRLMVVDQPARYYNLLAALEELFRHMDRAERSEA